MKHVTLFSIAFLLASSVSGCDELIPGWGGSGGGRISSYPMRAGNQWVYQRIAFQYNFRPIDTTYHFQHDTLRSLNTVDVLGTVRLPRVPGVAGDSITTTVFRAQESPSTITPGFTFYTSSGAGLYMHGYDGSSLIHPRPEPHNVLLMLNGQGFHSVRALVDYILEPLKTAMPVIQREYPPLLSIKYPLTSGDQWTFRPAGRPWRIDKQTGPARRHFGLGVRYHEVRWLYDINNDGVWDDGISILDWVSEKGLIRRFIDLRNVILTGSQGPDPIGYVDVFDESMLLTMRVY